MCFKDLDMLIHLCSVFSIFSCVKLIICLVGCNYLQFTWVSCLVVFSSFELICVVCLAVFSRFHLSSMLESI